MNKFFLFCIVLCACVCQSLNAVPVTPEEARQVAGRFFKEKGRKGDCTVREHKAVVQVRAGGMENPPFYICTPSDGKGFVVVSGDDALPQVVGYSLEAPAGNGLPEPLAACLASYSSYVEAVRQGRAQPLVRSSRKGDSVPIAPLLRTQWGQGAPYNDLCPADWHGERYPAGCVAAVAAQIMNYYRWPLSGTGTVSVGGEEIDLAMHAYDWDNMRDSYLPSDGTGGGEVGGGVTEAQRTAVATLVRDVGYALDMRYAKDGSMARHFDIVWALFKHFGYAPTLKYHHRKLYTRTTWYGIIRDELMAGRPVAYSGASGFGEEDGHSFICDGMDADGYLHINWGWDGAYDGYFDMDVLQPEGEGAGHDVGGYVERAGMVTGFRPWSADDKGEPQRVLMADGVEFSVLRGNSLRAEVGHVMNCTDAVRYLNPYFIWTDASGNVVWRDKAGFQSVGGQQRPMPGQIVDGMAMNGHETSLAAGIYTVWIENNPDGNGETYERFETGEMPDGVKVTVGEDGSLSIEPDTRAYHLEVVSCVSTGKVYAGLAFAEVEVCIRNTGDKAYEGKVEMSLETEDGKVSGAGKGGRVVATGGESPVFYAQSERTLRMSVSAPQEAGRYRARFSVDGETLPEDKPCYVEVRPRPLEPVLELSAPWKWGAGQEIVQAMEVPVSLSANVRVVPAADGTTLEDGTEVALYALRNGDDVSQEMRLCGCDYNSYKGTVSLETSTPLLSVLPEGVYRFYLKYADGEGMKELLTTNGEFGGVEVRLLPATSAFPYLSSPVTVNGGRVCKRYSTVDVVLPLSATHDFSGFVKVEDSYFNGTQWMDLLSSGLVPVRLGSGEDCEVTVRADVLREFDGERNVTVKVFDDQYNELGALALHPVLQDSYEYTAESGADERLKLAAPARFTDSGYFDPGNQGMLSLSVCANESGFRSGRLELEADAASVDGIWVSPLLAEPIAVNLLANTSKDVDIPFVCRKDALPGLYLARLYFRTDEGTRYPVLPDGMDYSLNFTIRKGIGVDSYCSDGIRVAAEGGILRVTGLNGKSCISLYATDGKLIFVEKDVESEYWEKAFPKVIVGQVFTLVVETDGQLGKMVRKLVWK